MLPVGVLRRFNPQDFWAGSRRPDFLVRRSTAAVGGAHDPRSSASGLLNAGERSAENGLRLFHGAALHEDGGLIDAIALEHVQRNAPRAGFAGPVTELEPAPRHVVVGDRASLVLAATDGDGRGLYQAVEP